MRYKWPKVLPSNWDDTDDTSYYYFLNSIEKDSTTHDSFTEAFVKQPMKIKKVIFNDPATIVYWKDGTKTVVKANNEPFDKEKGLAMAITKKALGNKGNFNNVFREWIK